MKVVKGDLIKLALEGHFDVIVHGCNCFCTMGSGIARQIRETFPQAYEEDCKTGKGDVLKLGTVSWGVQQIRPSFHASTKDLYIVNAYVQYSYGRGERHVEYCAIRNAFRDIKNKFGDSNSFTFAYPKIGAGLGGGDWNIISKIIDKELDGEDHTLVEFQT